MRTAAVLPIKRFALGEQRLGRSVRDAVRLELARAMVGDVLSALDACKAIDRVIVVTSDRSAASAASAPARSCWRTRSRTARARP